MNTSLIVTVLATDRSGLVNEISEVLRSHHANWMDSRMMRLAGQFSGLLQLSVANDHVTALTKALQELQNDNLHIQVKQSGSDELATIGGGVGGVNEELLKLEVLGQDRPGIIEDITRKLATLGVNIEEMLSEQRVASMSNEILFFAKLFLRVPEGVEAEDIQDALEAMSDQLMVDLNFS